MKSTSEIPFSDTPLHVITKAAEDDDLVATSAFGLGIAMLIASYDEAFIAADQAPLAPLLDAERGAELAASMREYAASNPDKTLESAVLASYNAMRANLTSRPKFH